VAGRDDDWRLTDQEKDLSGVQLFFRTWTQTRPDWDHDHCQFCWTRFGSEELKATQSGIEPVLRVGWTTANDYHWICETCFEDFRERFKWRT
jgi:hypothetical protein